MGNDTTETILARIDERTKNIFEDIKDIKQNYALKAELKAETNSRKVDVDNLRGQLNEATNNNLKRIEKVEKIIWGVVGFVFLSVGGALLRLVLTS